MYNHFISRRAEVILLSIAVYFLIQYNANSMIAPIYGYYDPRGLGFYDYLVSIILTVLPACLLPLDASPSSCSAWILYSFLYISSAIIGINILPSVLSYMSFMGYLGFCLFIFILLSRMRYIIPRFKVLSVGLDGFVVLAAVLVVVYIWGLSGFSLKLSFEDIYLRRIDARETIGSGGYFMAPIRLVIPIVAIYTWYVKKSLLWLFLFVFGSLAAFSFDGTKTTWLYPLVLLLIANGIRAGQLPRYLLVSIVLVSGFSVIEYQLNSSLIIADYGVRRAFIVPGMNSSFYWKFAPTATSLKSLTYDIGTVFFSDETNNANSNMFMYGVVWAGWGGGAVISIVSGALISIFNECPGKQFRFLGPLMASGCALYWSEQFLHTSMLTSGVFYVLVFAILLHLLPENFQSFRPNLDSH